MHPVARQDPKAFVIDVLSGFSKLDEIRPEHHLTRDLQLDSVDVMDALEQVEDEFGLTIPTDILPRMQTVADLVAEVDRRAKEATR